MVKVIFREQLLELAVKLGRQGLVWRNDKGRLLYPGNDVGHGKGLARTGHSKQDLVLVTALYPFGKDVYGLGLIACGFETSGEIESGHERIITRKEKCR